jgi:hypothetical protein
MHSQAPLPTTVQERSVLYVFSCTFCFKFNSVYNFVIIYTLSSIKVVHISPNRTVTKLWAKQPRIHDAFPDTGQGIFLLSKVSRLILESTKPSIQLLSEAPSLEKMNPGCNTEHSPITSAKVRNEYSYSFSAPYAFMAYTGLALTISIWFI